MRTHKFNEFKTYKLINSQFHNGHTCMIYLDAETNKGFEKYSGQLVDPSGNIVLTILSEVSMNEVASKLLQVAKILSNKQNLNVYVPISMRGES